MEKYIDNTSLLKMLIKQRKQTIETINNIERAIETYYRLKISGLVAEQESELINAKNNLREMQITLEKQTEEILTIYRSKQISEEEELASFPEENLKNQSGEDRAAYLKPYSDNIISAMTHFKDDKNDFDVEPGVDIVISTKEPLDEGVWDEYDELKKFFDDLECYCSYGFYDPMAEYSERGR